MATGMLRDLPPLLAKRPAWQADAACHEHPEVNFFDERQTEAAVAICSGCSCRDECLAFAVRTRTEYGVFGGQTPAERRPLWPAPAPAPAPKAAPARLPRTEAEAKRLGRGVDHGTMRAYAKGCHCGPCKAANTEWHRAYRARREAQSA